MPLPEPAPSGVSSANAWIWEIKHLFRPYSIHTFTPPRSRVLSLVNTRFASIQKSVNYKDKMLVDCREWPCSLTMRCSIPSLASSAPAKREMAWQKFNWQFRVQKWLKYVSEARSKFIERPTRLLCCVASAKLRNPHRIVPPETCTSQLTLYYVSITSIRTNTGFMTLALLGLGYLYQNLPSHPDADAVTSIAETTCDDIFRFLNASNCASSRLASV